VIRAKSKGRPLRIAYGRIFHEANSFSPLVTEGSAFEDFHYFEGEDLTRITTTRAMELAPALRRAELTGFVDEARREGNVEFVPLISALAVPSGPISRDCFDWLRSRLRAALEQVGEVDGVYLALHGSMRVAGEDFAPEGVIISDTRELIGDAKLAVSYDLHGNMSAPLVDGVDILEGYRTNPHRDLYRTGRRAGQQLIRSLRGELSPTRAWRKLPMLLGGGTTVDFLDPMRSIFMEIKRWTVGKKAVSANVFMVHPFTNAPDLGWSVHVCTDGDQELADRLADRLAERVWRVRHVPLPPLRDPRQAIDEVRRSRLSRTTGHVSLVDTSDVIGAGSTGGNTHLLDALVKDGADLQVYLPLHDPRAIDELWQQPSGGLVTATLRGTEGLDQQPTVTIDAAVESRKLTKFGRTVLLRHHALRIAVTEQPPGAIHPKFWTDLGLSPWKADAVVQKFFFHYMMFYVASGRRNIPVASAGPTNLDNIRARDYPYPVWPKDPVESWQDFDRIQRRLQGDSSRSASA
jgi:microcystin degradation protein MlrC